MRCFLLFLTATLLSAKPDFSGEWRLAGSDKSRILQIDHRDPTLVIRLLEDNSDATLFYSTDGVERTNELAGNTLNATTRWVGDVLEMKTSGKFGANDIALTDRYELSADRRTLTVKRHFEGKSPNGPLPAQDQVLVHELVPLKAGIARVDVTPSALGGDMYGYANRRCGVATGVHDPLLAKVLVLQSAALKIAIVTLDLGSFVAAKLSRDIQDKLGIPVVLLAASHSHSTPSFNPDLLASTEAKVFDAVKRASEAMFPARIRTTRGESHLGYNRLTLRENGRARAAFNNLERIPYGPLDSEFMLLEVAGVDGDPKALLVQYANHAVVLGPTNCKFSADFPGAMQSAIEAAVPGVQAMFVQGGAGDINPLFLARTGKEDEDFALVDRMGKLLAADVLKARVNLRPVDGYSQPLRAKSELLTFANRWEKDRRHEVGITTAMIGRDIAIAAVPGEALHTLQTTWKTRADVPFPLFFGYTFSGGGEWAGYIPDLRSAAYGGYGADSSTTRLEIGAGESILQRHLINLYTLRGMFRSLPGLP